MLLFRLLKCFYFQNKQLDEIPDKTHSIPFLLWSYLPSKFVFYVGNSTEGQRVCNMSPIKSGQLQKNPCSINGFMTDQRATAKTSLINCSEGGDWQTPEYSSYFCRIRSRERLYNLYLYPDSQPDHSVPYMLLILLLFPLCSVIWMLLYLFKKKSVPSFPFIPFFHFLHHQVFRKSALTLCWTPANTHVPHSQGDSLSPFSLPITNEQCIVCSPVS